jgi:SAM-dependent methyltransferase
VGADANESFPFCDGAFDCVVSREGIEHLENQAAFLRECARVLKGGGTLMITTPNLLHLAARASQFLTGQRNLRRGLVNEVQTPRSLPGPHMYHGHAFLIDYFRMRYLLRLAGFGRLRITTDHYSPTSIFLGWLVPVLYAAMRFSARTAHRAARKKGRVASPPELTAEIIGHVLSPALLFGKRMIITAEKIRA